MKRLEVRELTVEFGSRRVVDRISFSIDAGERMALVGESGSGKTVTALSLLRLIEAARLSGEILFEGRNCTRDVRGGTAWVARAGYRRNFSGTDDRAQSGI